MTTNEILTDPTASYWLKDAILSLSQRDSLDALIDVEVLLEWATNNRAGPTGQRGGKMRYIAHEGGVIYALSTEAGGAIQEALEFVGYSTPAAHAEDGHSPFSTCPATDRLARDIEERGWSSQRWSIRGGVADLDE